MKHGRYCDFAAAKIIYHTDKSPIAIHSDSSFVYDDVFAPSFVS